MENNACAVDADCLSNMCICAVCRTLGNIPDGGQCTADNQCLSRKCKDGSKTQCGICQVTKQEGASCMDSYECQSDFCICEKCRNYGQILDDDNCKEHDQCQSGKCYGSSPFSCGTCQAKKPEGSSCSENADCKSNYCKCGTCQTDGEIPNGDGCNGHEQCLSGQCQGWSYTECGSCQKRTGNMIALFYHPEIERVFHLRS